MASCHGGGDGRRSSSLDSTTKVDGDRRLLTEGDKNFRLLVQGVRDYAIFLMSPEGLVASWNEGAKRIKGYEEEEIVGCHFSR